MTKTRVYRDKDFEGLRQGPGPGQDQTTRPGPENHCNCAMTITEPQSSAALRVHSGDKCFKQEQEWCPPGDVKIPLNPPQRLNYNLSYPAWP